MEYVTLDANAGTGETSFSKGSTWKNIETDKTTTKVTYNFFSSPGNGWVFKRWEYKQRSITEKDDGTSTSAWSSDWISLSSSENYEHEFTCLVEYEENIFGFISTTYEYIVRAVFERRTYTVTPLVASDSAGIGFVSGGGSGYHLNDWCTVTAYTYVEYKFVKWTSTDSAQATAVSTNAIYQFRVTGDTTLYAHFRQPTGKLLCGSSGKLLCGTAGTLLYDD